jgi:hypothetical protein
MDQNINKKENNQEKQQRSRLLNLKI